MDYKNKTKIDSKEASFLGYIKDDIKVDGDQLSFVFQNEQKEKLYVFYRLKSEQEKEWASTLRYGSYVKVNGELQIPKGQRVPNGFDYRDYLKQKKIHWTIRSKEVILLNKEHISLLFSVKNFRQKMIGQINESYTPLTAAFINALVLGYVDGMDNAIQDQYEKYGLSHLLAISGSHFTLLIAGVSLGLWRMGLTREKTMGVLLVLIPLYAVLAGGAPSVVRAAFSGSIVIFSLLFQRKHVALDILSMVFICLLFINPYYIFDIGFQLSFIVSASLLISSGSILRKELSYTKLTLWVTIISQLCSLPIVLENFYDISPYSLLLNVFFIPFLSFIILPLCIIASFLYWTPLQLLLNVIIENGIDISNQLLSIFQILPFRSFTFGSLSIFTGCCVWGGIYYYFVCWEDGNIKRGLVPFLGILAILYISPLLRVQGIVTFLDVGQGDCAIIELPFGRGVYVIDTGGSLPFQKDDWQERKSDYRVGEKVVIPYLKSRGIRQIDKLILTHGDYDHIGETLLIMDEIDVEEVLVGKKEKRSSLEKEVIRMAIEKKVNVIEVENGMSWKRAGMTFSILGPIGGKGEENNQSIILYTQLGGKYFLFTGDLEEDGERGVVTTYPKLPVDVLKIGHHGSKSSTSQQLLDVCSPEIGVISVGETNRYNHPHSDVIKRLEESGVQILRTDKSGTIQYVFLKTGTFR